MGDLLFPDFVTKSRQYTKGGGIDDMKGITDEIRAIGREANPYDTAPCELPQVWPDFYHAPDQDPA